MELKKAISKKLYSVPASTARTQFGELMRKADEEHIKFVVERVKKPSVVIMAYTDYQDLIETIEEETDISFQKSLKEAKKQIKLGNYKTLDELIKESK